MNGEYVGFGAVVLAGLFMLWQLVGVLDANHRVVEQRAYDLGRTIAAMHQQPSKCAP